MRPAALDDQVELAKTAGVRCLRAVQVLGRHRGHCDGNESPQDKQRRMACSDAATSHEQLLHTLGIAIG
jgi:hypothetical protein